MRFTEAPEWLDKIPGQLAELNARAGKWDQFLQAMEAERAREAGIKPIRLAPIIGTGSASLVMGGDTQPLHSPQEGMVWAVRELIVEGLATGASPDIINIWRRGSKPPAGIPFVSPLGQFFWQLNGNQFAQTWGYGEKLLWPGEALLYSAGAVFAATGQIVAHGIVENVPGQMVGKLYD
jgi:hypothetical protein